jgi:hypothetical protein
MGYLANYFEWLGQVGPMSIYRNTKAIPPEMLHLDPNDVFPAEASMRLHELAVPERISRARRFACELSLVSLINEKRGAKAALDRLAALPETYSDLLTGETGAAKDAAWRLRRLRRRIEKRGRGGDQARDALVVTA